MPGTQDAKDRLRRRVHLACLLCLTDPPLRYKLGLDREKIDRVR